MIQWNRIMGMKRREAQNMVFRNNWVRAILINVVILVLALILTYMSYETNDDYAIASRLQAGDPYTGYVDYYLCLLLVELQKLLPMVNAFVVTEVFLSFAAFTMITKVILDLERRIWFTILFIMILALYSIDQYCILQFTKTSALLVTVGMLLLVDAMIRCRPWGYYPVALILFYLGAAIRIKNIAVGIGFAGLFLLLWVIENRRSLRSEGYLTTSKIVSSVVLLFLVFGALGMNMWSNQINESAEGLKTYHDYNGERSDVIDYSGFDQYEESEKEFDALGLSENDLYLIHNWYFDYDGAASEENLHKVNQIYAKNRENGPAAAVHAAKSCVKHIISQVRKHTATGIHLSILAVIAILGLILLKPHYWPFLFAAGAATFCIYLGLFYIGRPAYRAMYVADLGATLWLLYYFDWFKCWSLWVDRESGMQKAASVAVGLVSIALIIGLAGGIWLGWERCADKHQKMVSNLRPAALTERIAGDPNHVYVFSTREKKNLPSYASPLRAPQPDPNVLTFGGWGTKSPYLLEKMKGLGLDNVFGDIIGNEKVYVIEDRNVDRMEDYFNKWYGEEGKPISYEPVDEVDGFRIWHVVRK